MWRGTIVIVRHQSVTQGFGKTTEMIRVKKHFLKKSTYWRAGGDVNPLEYLRGGTEH